MSVLDLAVSSSWAMLEDDIARLVAIAGRETSVSPQALEAYAAKQANGGERLAIRGGVGIIEMSGPLFKRANLFTRMSGATSYGIMRMDLQAALDDPAIHSIILRIDSPGGEASGCDEFATAIYEARGKKPITAYISGCGASAAYWIASAADEIIVSDLAQIGSIGVVLGMRKNKDDNSIEFVSSQSPNKRPDTDTDGGKGEIQTVVDDMAAVFVSAIAKYRGVDEETVLKKFGAGGIKIGAKAVAAGMVDKVGQLEATITALNSRGSSRRSIHTATGGHSMSGNTEASGNSNTDILDEGEIRADAVATATAETQARIKSILGCEHASKCPKTAKHIAFETSATAEEATALLAAASEDIEAATATGSNDDTKSYEERKTEAGTLGLAAPESRDAKNNASGSDWGKAVTKINSRTAKA